MSRWLQMADKGVIEGNTPTDTLTEPDKSPPAPQKPTFCPVLSGCREGELEKSKSASPEPGSVANVASVAATPDKSIFKHGRSLTGRPLTWTGKIVSLEDWRSLSDWERNGSEGRVWCGCCEGWHLQGECSDG